MQEGIKSVACYDRPRDDLNWRLKSMKDAVGRLNVEYGFNLSDDEIDLIAKQAEQANRLFQPLFEVDLTGIMPIMKIDKRVKKVKK